MNRWVYWASLLFIAVIIGLPVLSIATDPLISITGDPRGALSELFKKGIDLEGGTSLIYDLRPPVPGGTAPSAKDAKHVILQRIDPNGTHGYIVRPIGATRLEIVLPGKQTKVSITEEPVTAENLAAADKAANTQNKATAEVLQTKAATFQTGTRLVVRMKPALYLDDVQSRITQAVRERMPGKNPVFAVVGLEPEGEQWKTVAILLGVKPADAAARDEWMGDKGLLRNALASQRDVTRVKRLVRQAGYLEFKIIADKVRDRGKADFDRIVADKIAGKDPYTPEFRWYPLKNGWQNYLNKNLDTWNYIYVPNEADQTVDVLVNAGNEDNRVTGDDIARAGASTQDGEPIVTFALNPTAGARFASLTNPDMRDRHMAIILDGTIQSAPALRATLSSGGIIEGYHNNQRERDEVVTILNSGKLSASLGDPVTERTVSSELGADNIQKGFQASALGFILVVLFMGVYYRFAGVVADLALILNLILIICIMFTIRQAWTLPGIAGLILSLAMAVDANVLIYERLREEKEKGGSLLFALKKAYERAFTTIFDSNFTTVIPAFVLLLPGLATEEVKGFAVVMIIGIAVSMFTAVVVTRMIFETGIQGGWIKELKMFHLFQKPNIDWMRFARVGFVVTTALAVLGLVAFLGRGQSKYDIEFVGGTQVVLALKDKSGGTVPIDLVRQRATDVLGGAATVQSVEYGTEESGAQLSRFIVSVPASGGSVSGEAAVKEALAKAFADMQPEGKTIQVKVLPSMITAGVIRAEAGLSATPTGTAPAAAAPASTSTVPTAPAPASTVPSATSSSATSTRASAPQPIRADVARAEMPAPTAAPSHAAATSTASSSPTATTSATATTASTSTTASATSTSATSTTATDTAVAPKAVEAVEVRARGVPQSLRLFLDKTRLEVTLSSPMATDEVRNLLYAYVRDHYSDLVGMARDAKITGRTPAATPGEFTSFDVWIMAPFNGIRQDKKNPEFWAETIQAALSAGEAFASTSSFEPTMAEEAWNKAVLAILFSIAAMTLYIWLRFAKLSSGLAAVIAMLHDVLVTLGAVSVAYYVSETPFGRLLMLTDMKVNLPLVGAFLTLVGYSVNDTIVVFDRIRENRGKYGDLSIAVINNSINQTLSRTVLTSLTVFVAVVALYFVGGKTSSIHGLAFVMLFGTVVGTYSSIAIASPILALSDYLKRLYVWAYPLAGALLLAYFIFVWKTPAEFFGSWVGPVWVVLQLGWLAVAYSAVRSEVYGLEWKLLSSAEILARLVAFASMLAPVMAIIFFILAVTMEMSVAAWAGPAALGALATCPAMYFICRMVWRKESSGDTQQARNGK